MIARGVMLGPDQPVILHMLDIPPAAEALNGVKMELVDAAFPLLKGGQHLDRFFVEVSLFFYFIFVLFLFLFFWCYLRERYNDLGWSKYNMIFFLYQVLLLPLMLLRHALRSTLQSWLVGSLGKKAWKEKMLCQRMLPFTNLKLLLWRSMLLQTARSFAFFDMIDLITVGQLNPKKKKNLC